MLDRFLAGAFDRAWDRVFEEVRPRNGAIRIRFESQVQNAKVCAIEIVPPSSGRFP